MKTMKPLCLLFLLLGCASAPPSRPARTPDRARPARRVALFVVDDEPAPALDPSLPQAPIAAHLLVSAPAVPRPRPEPAAEPPLHPMAGQIVEQTDMVTTKVIGRTHCEDQREVVLLHRYHTRLLARVEFPAKEMALESRPLISGERWTICPPASEPGQYVRTVITYHLCRPDIADRCEPERFEGNLEVDILPARLLSHEITIMPSAARGTP